MKFDFTINVFLQLLRQIQCDNYQFIPVKDFLSIPDYAKRIAILRHDVDKRPDFALRMAKLENGLNIKGTYYFRIKNNIFIPDLLKEIASLGHEIGYHYEDLSDSNGDFMKAWETFQLNLSRMRNEVDVTSICMHGSPLSKFKNIDLWKKYNYRDLGIIGEPYKDIDFKKLEYFTDTGRKWNKFDSSINDFTDSSYLNLSTFELIDILKKGKIKRPIFINFHPQRWTENVFIWTQEKYFQFVKNIIKRSIKTKNEITK